MKLTRELIDEIKKENKNNYIKIKEMASEEFYIQFNQKGTCKSKNMILNAAMGKSLRIFSEDIAMLGAITDNKTLIDILEGLVETFKESEKEMMEAQDEQ